MKEAAPYADLPLSGCSNIIVVCDMRYKKARLKRAKPKHMLQTHTNVITVLEIYLDLGA